MFHKTAAPIAVPPAAIPPTAGQRRWLRRGLDQPGGKLPLFDQNGQKVGARLVRSCIEAGWAEPWFNNPLKPDWLVCRLTEAGRQALGDGGSPQRPKTTKEHEIARSGASGRR